MKTEYENLLLIGGSGNGQYVAIMKNTNLVRIPGLKPVAVLKAKGPSAILSYDSYRRQTYRDKSGLRKDFLLHESISEASASIELYLLGVTDLDGNFECNAVTASRGTNKLCLLAKTN